MNTTGGVGVCSCACVRACVGGDFNESPAQCQPCPRLMAARPQWCVGPPCVIRSLSSQHILTHIVLPEPSEIPSAFIRSRLIFA